MSATSMGMAWDINRSDGGLDRWIIRGLCDKCGELIGTLKSATRPALTATATTMYENDRLMYHVSPIMTKAKIKCEPSKGS